MPIIAKYGKVTYTDAENEFIRSNFDTMTNSELAAALGVKITHLRMHCYNVLGLKRMELQYWTQEQVEFLRGNYKRMGDTEIAELFALKYPKAKGWSKKHIEKKRRYLKLKRTKKQIKGILQRNIDRGVYVEGNRRMWETRGIAPVGEVRYWKHESGREFAVVKTEEGFVHYNRFLYEKNYGSIPDDMIVAWKDGNSRNASIENLELITRAELARRNNIFDLPEELQQIIKLKNKLNKKIKKYGKKQAQ